MKRVKRSSRASRPARGGGEPPEQVLFLPEAHGPGEQVRLEGAEAEHALRSLRIRTGDPIHLVDGDGSRHAGSVARIEKHSLEVRIESTERLRPWPGRRIWLAAGILRTARMDLLVEKASELGAERFIPLALKHCVARPSEEGVKTERWGRIAVESLKQCRRARLMEVADPLDLDGFLAALPAERHLFVADPGGEDPASLASAHDPAPVVVVVGPEGGLAEEELGILVRHGARRIALGGHRLRAETAGLVLLTLAVAASGGMSAGVDR